MRDTLDLKGTLIPVGREIRAKVGDRLIVVAGICIGVYTGEEGIPVAPLTKRTTSEDKEESVSKSKPSTKKYNQQRAAALASGNFVPAASVAPIMESIRKLFESRSEYTAVELRRLLNDKDGKDWRVRDALRCLLHSKEITAEGSNRHRLYVYRGREAA